MSQDLAQLGAADQLRIQTAMATLLDNKVAWPRTLARMAFALARMAT